MSASTNDLLTHRRAAVRKQPDHAGRPGQRRQRCIRRPRRALSGAAGPAVSHAPRSTISNAATSIASRQSEFAGPISASIASRSTTASTTICDTLEEYQQFRARGRGQGLSAFFGSVRSQRSGTTCSRSRSPRSSTISIARTLAGVAQAGRPVFLKIVYHGPRAMEELVAYDPHLVVGILGGAAGTTYDAFKLLAEAQEVWSPGGPLWPQDQQRRMPVGVYRVSATDRRRSRSRRKKRCGPITAFCRDSRFDPIARSKMTWF